jgi:hypothetical protein
MMSVFFIPRTIGLVLVKVQLAAEASVGRRKRRGMMRVRGMVIMLNSYMG